MMNNRLAHSGRFGAAIRTPAASAIPDAEPVYRAGDTVMYPSEGVCTIVELRRMALSGMPERTYYVLKPATQKGSSTVYLPVARGNAILRSLLSEQAIRDLIRQSEAYAGLWIADSKLRKPLVISNPLGEDTSVMRTTALPSMLEILARNYNNRNESARLFEIGKEYLPTTPDQLPQEPARLTIGMYGGNVDFYDLKGVIEALMTQLKITDCRYERCGEECPFDEKSAFHPGRSAVLYAGDTPLGIFGELHPDVQNNYGIGVKTYAAKLNIPEMLEHAAT